MIQTCPTLVRSVRRFNKNCMLCPVHKSHLSPLIAAAMLDAAIVLAEYLVNLCSAELKIIL